MAYNSKRKLLFLPKYYKLMEKPVDIQRGMVQLAFSAFSSLVVSISDLYIFIF
jgi:hypothetical protein